MSTALTSVPAPLEAATLEAVLLGGDLTKLKPGERVAYMTKVCESLGLNPLTKPFEFITLNGKLVMYARRECTEQLRKLNGVSIRITARELVEDVYIVTASATDRSGRVDESTGAVSVKGLAGENKANALMKAETKAKRRVTLSISGLGMLDESEVSSVPGATAWQEPQPPKAGKPAAAAASAPSTAQASTSAPTASLPASSTSEAAAGADPDGVVETPAGFVDQVECWRWQKLGGTAKGGDMTGEWVSIGTQPQRTLEQNALMHVLRAERGLTDEEWRSRLVSTFNKTSSTDLSVDEASLAIEKLQRALGKYGTGAEKQDRKQKRAEAVGAELQQHYDDNERELSRVPGAEG